MAPATLDVETGTFASQSVTRLLERLAYRVNAAIHSHDEKCVHDVRVAIRRFTQALVLFKPVFSSKEVRKMRRRVKEIMRLSSDVRDYDIALEMLAHSKLPAVPEFIRKLRDRRKEALALLLASLRNWAARRTTAKWRAALTPNGGSHKPLSETARDRLPRIAKKFLKDGVAASSAAELHRVRIEGKKLRYSLEILAAAFPTEVGGAVTCMKDIQTALGDIHDCHAVRLLIDDLGGDAKIDAWLKRRQRKKIRQFREAWPATADALRHSVRMLKHPTRKPMAADSSPVEMATRTA